MSLVDEVLNESQTDRMVGQVKWFNNKAGYGFITVSEGELANKDIFIHYSSVRVTNSQYKYLVQGEYVEFNLVTSSNGAHEYQATDVSGIKGGSLMCEARRSTRPLDETAVRPVRRFRQSRDDSEKPRSARQEGEEYKDEFTTVRRRKPTGERKQRVETPKEIAVESN